MSTQEENILKNNKYEELGLEPDAGELFKSFEDEKQHISNEITKENEEVKNADALIETANDSIGLPDEEVQAVKNEMGIDGEIAQINTEADRLTEEAQNEINSETPTKTTEKPPIPPLPEKEKVEEVVEKTPEQIKVEELRVKLEAAKDKKFNELVDKFTKEQERKEKDPDSPVNKILNTVIAKNKQSRDLGNQIINRALGEADRPDFGEYPKSLGVTPQEFEASIPELYNKGLIENVYYKTYLSIKFRKNNGELRYPEFNKALENIPLDIIKKLDESGIMTAPLDAWFELSDQEIKKEINNTGTDRDGIKYIREPEKLLKIISNFSRLINEEKKEEITPNIDMAVEQYLKFGGSVNGRINKNDKAPVLENLCQAGFSNQAEKILEKGLRNRESGCVYLILDYTKKGYFTNEQAKNLLDKAGWFE